MYCVNCGKEIDDNAVVCVHCGVKVPRQFVRKEVRFCTNCGKQIDPKAVVCVHCGVPTQGARNAQARSAKTTTSPMVYAILCMALSALGLFVVGAVLGMVGTVRAIVTKNKSRLLLCVVALVVCFIFCFLGLFVEMP